ncbi:MAG: DUF2807 domain-containing protein [Spirochaetaceae bacterium]|jgi:hypothetical protein|nr:DUF2807 domain-containing protein [Spirochaetaceae bacterium]
MERKGLVLFFLVLIVMSFVTGCNFWDLNAKKGDGIITSQEKTVSGFNTVVGNGIGNIHIYPAEDYKLVVTTDSNIQDDIGIAVRNNTLHIEDNNNQYKPTQLVIDVYMPELEAVSLNGSGSIKVNTGTTSAFKIGLFGSGSIDTQTYQVQYNTIDLSGSGSIKTMATDTLSVDIFGSGSIDAQNHGVKNADITVSGSGSIKIWVTDALTGEIFGSGTIWYKGTPTQSIDKTGTGSAKTL